MLFLNKYYSRINKWISNLIYKPIYPLLFGIYPILFLYQHNIAELTSDVMYVPILVTIILVSILLLALNLIYRSWDKSAVLVALLIVVFFNYYPAVNSLPHLLFKFGGVEITRGIVGTALALILILGIFVYLIKSKPKILSIATKPLNVIACTLVLFTVIGIVPHEINRRASHGYGVNSALSESSPQYVANVSSMDRPDVYYLIFDKYASNQSLLDYYGYDNAGFHEELHKRGFFVAEKSRTNYPSTVFSLSSSLNMDYIQNLVDMTDPSLSVATTLHKLFTNNKVGQLFKENGYTYYHLGNWYDPTRKVDIADVNLLLEDSAQANNFIVELLEDTLYKRLGSIGNIAPIGSTSHSQREILNYQFEKIRQIPHDDSPTFTVMHALLPHDPFVFNSECEDIPILGIEYSSPSDYINHVECTNIKALEAIDYLLSNSDEPPVIIIQSDEGSRQYVNGKDTNKLYNFEGAPDSYLLERTGIQNAYYFPDRDYSQLYESISPVNTFRVVLGKYLNYNVKLKDDKYYVFPDPNHMFDFIDSTDKLERFDKMVNK